MSVYATYTQAEIDEILQLFDQHDAVSRQIRNRLARAAFKELHGEPEPKPEPYGYKVRLTQADIQQMNIPWFVKGMQPAETGAAFAFTFATEKDGTPKPEIQPLVDELKLYKKITVGPYEYRLGGRDKNLISRNKAKEART